jgi:hypothetical protein
MRSLLVFAAAAMAVPIAASAQSDSSSSDGPEGKVLAECISRQATLLYLAPDAASEVAQAVITACEKQHRAMVAKLSAAKVTAAQVEDFEDFLRRSAQHQVIFERAARATIRE